MQIYSPQMFEHIIDSLHRGIILVDRELRIQYCNNKSLSIIGVAAQSPSDHPAGTIRPGDIVILADNMFGGDDGRLGDGGLANLNIDERSVSDGDVLLCAGVYKNPNVDPVVKILKEHHLSSSVALEATYFGFRIRSSINNETGEAVITVNGADYVMRYYHNCCNVVVLDGANGSIRFAQALGYTGRRESAGELLRGGHFRSKRKTPQHVNVAGRPLASVYNCPDMLRHIRSVLDGATQRINDRLYEVDQIPLIGQISPVRDDEGEITGALIDITNIEDTESSVEHGRTILQELEDTRQRISYEADFPPGAFAGISGHSPQITEVKYLAYKASQNKFTVCITGESGTGKTILAREIHNLGNRNAPFIEVNINAISPTLIESELFGYVKGAFTGASKEGKTGFFEAANGGTIFLDEIGELSPEIQIKLLQVLQSKTIYRVGSATPIKVDVRMIVATNQDLKAAVKAETFRKDLYYRINVFPIEIPPLRERKGDLYLLVNSLLARICESYGLEPKQFSGEAIQALISYSWPGNIRELENVIERAVTLCDSNLIHPEHLRLETPSQPHAMKELLQQEEMRILEATLLKYNGDKNKAMEELEMSRADFYRKLSKYGIDSASRK
ncbi:MAG: sigma 54-interacting transcriptional regulator [Eubacterium sp.]|nr:sigma 54-interacting transcriptional regulator [Eubacterium sp.]